MNRPVITKNQVIDSFSVSIIRKIVLGEDISTIIDDLIEKNIPEPVAQVVVNELGKQVIS